MTSVDQSNAMQHRAAEMGEPVRSPSRFRRTWRLGIQAVAVAYLLALTLLLVHPDVFAWLGMGAKSVEKQVDVTVPGLLQHFSAYVLLGVLLYVGFVGPRFPAMSILAVTVLHGLTTESIQAFEIGRASCRGRV